MTVAPGCGKSLAITETSSSAPPRAMTASYSADRPVTSAFQPDAVTGSPGLTLTSGGLVSGMLVSSSSQSRARVLIGEELGAGQDRAERVVFVIAHHTAAERPAGVGVLDAQLHAGGPMVVEEGAQGLADDGAGVVVKSGKAPGEEHPHGEGLALLP